jgi:hypothetical protein
MNFQVKHLHLPHFAIKLKTSLGTSRNSYLILEIVCKTFWLCSLIHAAAVGTIYLLSLYKA